MPRDSLVAVIDDEEIFLTDDFEILINSRKNACVEMVIDCTVRVKLAGTPAQQVVFSDQYSRGIRVKFTIGDVLTGSAYVVWDLGERAEINTGFAPSVASITFNVTMRVVNELPVIHTMEAA